MSRNRVLKTSYVLRNPIWVLLAAFLYAMYLACYALVWVPVTLCVLAFRGGRYLVRRQGPSPYRAKDDVLGRGSIDDSPDVW